MQAILKSALELSERIEAAANATARDFAQGIVAQETTFTDRLLGRIDAAVDEFEGRGVRWRARTLLDRSPRSEEREFGADFMGVFQASGEELFLSKGFLAQAKLVPIGQNLPRSELMRLQGQCDDMLRHTPDAFVFIYNEHGVQVLSATAVAALRGRRLNELAPMPVGEFFSAHFRCFIGDGAIASPTVITLEGLRRRLAPKALFITAQEERPRDAV